MRIDFALPRLRFEGLFCWIYSASRNGSDAVTESRNQQGDFCLARATQKALLIVRVQLQETFFDFDLANSLLAQPTLDTSLIPGKHVDNFEALSPRRSMRCICCKVALTGAQWPSPDGFRPNILQLSRMENGMAVIDESPRLKLTCAACLWKSTYHDGA